MKTLRQILFLLVLVVVVFSTSTVFASSLEEDIVYYVNIERQAAGLAPVTLNYELNHAAAIRAQEASVYFAHQRPDGRPVKSVLNGASYSWFGENLAISSVTDAKRIVRAWMGSPTHRANMLNRHYTQMGIACTHGADGRLYWAQMLASDKEAK